MPQYVSTRNHPVADSARRFRHCPPKFAAVIAGCCFLLAAQEGPQVSITPRPQKSLHPPADIKIDVDEVLIPVTVTDPYGKPVLGIPSQRFKIYEDGVEQPISRLANQDMPLSVGILFDSSMSMKGKLDRSQAAIAQLLKSSMPEDEYFVVGFNDSAKLLSPFSPDEGDVQRALSMVQPLGWTSLFDAMYLGVAQMKKAHHARRVLVILSDGGDNNSRYSEREIRSLLRESDVIVYAIGIADSMTPAGDLKMLGQMADDTGGRMFKIGNVSQLPEAIEKLNTAMRDQYTLAYRPINSAHDGKFRRVLVKILPSPETPRVRASWRTGYYAQ